jgi:heat shock protein HslJ
MSMKLSFPVLIFGWLMIAGCSHTAQSPMIVNELIGTEWVLEEIDGRGVVDNVQSTLRFEGNDRIIGWGGCNRYFTGVRSTGNGIKLGPIGSTRRICPPVVMEQEDLFFQTLEKARTIHIEGRYLVIECEGIKKPLQFVRLKSSGA